MSAEPRWLICHDVAAVPGSERAVCSLCGARLYVAPSGQRMRRERDLTVVCVACAKVGIANDPDARIEPVSPEQLSEMTSVIFDRRRN
jgi:hypothetical protein